MIQQVPNLTHVYNPRSVLGTRLASCCIDRGGPRLPRSSRVLEQRVVSAAGLDGHKGVHGKVGGKCLAVAEHGAQVNSDQRVCF